MKLDTKALRYLTAEDWRVLTAVELGSKNHEVVPTPLIVQLSSLRSGSGVHKCISTLAKANLIARMKNAKYDGYRLTYGGLDYLALHTHLKHKTLYSTGNCIGVGKESDIYVVADSSGKQLILKIHRLGRISFRSIKNNRDYLKHRTSASWMYMSRLAALKEYSFMRVLKKNGFNVPEPVAQNRHTVVMELIDAFPLRQIQSVPDPAGLYAELIDMILRLASFGLIHGDFNEFNILIKEVGVPSEPGTANSQVKDDKAPQMPDTKFVGSRAVPTITPVMIDFPQMISIDHANAEMYFDRDIGCVKRFFERRFNFISDVAGPHFADVKKLTAANKGNRLDVEVEASGFSKKMARELEKYMEAIEVDGHGSDGDEGDGDEGDGVHSSDEPPDESNNDQANDTRGPHNLHVKSEIPIGDIAGLSNPERSELKVPREIASACVFE